MSAPNADKLVKLALDAGLTSKDVSDMFDEAVAEVRNGSAAELEKKRQLEGITSGFPVAMLRVFQKLKTQLISKIEAEKNVVDDVETEYSGELKSEIEKILESRKMSTFEIPLIWISAILALVYCYQKDVDLAASVVIFLAASAITTFRFLRYSELNDRVQLAVKSNGDLSGIPEISHLPGIKRKIVLEKGKSAATILLEKLNEEAFEKNNWVSSAEIQFEDFCLKYYVPIYKKYVALQKSGLSEREINEQIKVEFFEQQRDLVSGEIKEGSPSEGFLKLRLEFWNLLGEFNLFEEFLAACASYVGGTPS